VHIQSFKYDAETRLEMDPLQLQQLGLTENEAKVYLSLLKLGQTTAGPIVDDSKVTRSKIYDLLERLKTKGLVSYVIKGATRHYSAADPSAVLQYIENKKEQLEKEKTMMEKLLPQLLLQQNLAKEKKFAEVFVGIRGMENAFLELARSFNAKDIYYALGASPGENQQQMQLFFTRLHKKRVEKKVKSFILFNEQSRGLFHEQEKSKFVKAKYLSQSTPTAINVYKDITIIAVLTSEPTTILIKNQETAQTFREFFETMWKEGKK